MSREPIKNTRSIEAYQFIVRAWELSHPHDKNTNGEYVLPEEFQGAYAKNATFIVNWFLPLQFQVPRVRDDDIKDDTYLAAQPGSAESPFVEFTNTLIHYACRYAQIREQNFFRRDKNISYPRNQLIKYFCRQALQLSRHSIGENLCRRYQAECDFLTHLLSKAHDFFPTSHKNDGRDGFHAVLMDMETHFKNLKIMADTALERQSLKERINRLTNCVKNATTALIEFMSLTFNNTRMESHFNPHQFYYRNDSYPDYRASPMGACMAVLIKIYYTNAPEIESNPFVHELEKWLSSFEKNSDTAIPEKFLKSPLLTLFIQLHALAFEMIYLHRVLSELESGAGFFGDYSLTHNKLLCEALDNALISWKRLSFKADFIVDTLLSAQQQALREKPSDKSDWACHYRASESYARNFKIDYHSGAAVTGEIQDTIENLRKMGAGEYQKKLTGILSLAQQFMSHLIAIRLISPQELASRSPIQTQTHTLVSAQPMSSDTFDPHQLRDNVKSYAERCCFRNTAMIPKTFTYIKSAHYDIHDSQHKVIGAVPGFIKQQAFIQQKMGLLFFDETAQCFLTPAVGEWIIKNTDLLNDEEREGLQQAYFSDVLGIVDDLIDRVNSGKLSDITTEKNNSQKHYAQLAKLMPTLFGADTSTSIYRAYITPLFNWAEQRLSKTPCETPLLIAAPKPPIATIPAVGLTLTIPPTLAALPSFQRLLCYANHLMTKGTSSPEKPTYVGEGYHKGRALKCYLQGIIAAEQSRTQESTSLLANGYKPTYHFQGKEKSVTEKRLRWYHPVCLFQHSESCHTHTYLQDFKTEMRRHINDDALRSK